LGSAVIGGLLFATFATLIFVPTMYKLLRRQPVPVTIRTFKVEPMQSHDPEHPETPPHLSENPAHSQYPDEVSRAEHDDVSTSFDPGTGRSTKRGVGIAAALLGSFVL
jgi:hypothetical protein